MTLHASRSKRNLTQSIQADIIAQLVGAGGLPGATPQDQVWWPRTDFDPERFQFYLRPSYSWDDDGTGFASVRQGDPGALHTHHLWLQWFARAEYVRQHALGVYLLDAVCDSLQEAYTYRRRVPVLDYAGGGEENQGDLIVRGVAPADPVDLSWKGTGIRVSLEWVSVDVDE